MTPDFDPKNYLIADGLAAFLGYPNVEAMRHDVKVLPAPDTVFVREPYWSRETAQALLEARHNAIRAAWGYKEPQQ